jgi:anti-sigma regulatory factor (Ser/Thr protein kinase)
VEIDERLPRRAVAAPQARALVSEALGGGCDACGHDLSLVITELVANAVRHGRGRRIALRMRALDGTVRVEVENRRWTARPRARVLTTTRPDGRGLSLVAAFSERWGVESARRGRTRVWAEVRPDI